MLPPSFTRQRFCFDLKWPISLFALVINSLLLSVRERHRKGWGGEGRGGGKKGWGVFLPFPSLCAYHTCSKLIDSSNLVSLVNIMYSTSAS